MHKSWQRRTRITWHLWSWVKVKLFNSVLHEDHCASHLQWSVLLSPTLLNRCCLVGRVLVLSLLGGLLEALLYTSCFPLRVPHRSPWAYVSWTPLSLWVQGASGHRRSPGLHAQCLPSPQMWAETLLQNSQSTSWIEACKATKLLGWFGEGLSSNFSEQEDFLWVAPHDDHPESWPTQGPEWTHRERGSRPVSLTDSGLAELGRTRSLALRSSWAASGPSILHSSYLQ